MKHIQPKIVYSPGYDFRFYGIERLHPFDGRKFSKAWEEIAQVFDIKKMWALCPSTPVTREDLCRVHTEAYLNQLQSPEYVARALELPILLPLALISPQFFEKHVLYPMRLATQGTILAAEAALEGQIAINLGGGYHHARRSEGEGFCIYSDIAIAVAKIRSEGKIKQDDKILIIDLDAHQSNGLERIFYDDPAVYIFDMYNQQIYPQDRWAQKRINCDIRLKSKMIDKEYINILKEKIAKVMDNLKEKQKPKIAFYVAGTDIYYRDQLGQLNITGEGILQRDTLVFNTLTEAGIPWVMTLGGGYSKESYMLVARSICYVFNTWKPLLSNEDTHNVSNTRTTKAKNNVRTGKKLDLP